MNVLQNWLKEATIPQRERLIKYAKTTLGGLRQLAGAYRTGGKVHATPELAAAIEKASIKVGGELPAIKREDLCLACGKCELAKIAREVQGVHHAPRS